MLEQRLQNEIQNSKRGAMMKLTPAEKEILLDIFNEYIEEHADISLKNDYGPELESLKEKIQNIEVYQE